jgi:hypothetical protein
MSGAEVAHGSMHIEAQDASTAVSALHQILIIVRSTIDWYPMHGAWQGLAWLCDGCNGGNADIL